MLTIFKRNATASTTNNNYTMKFTLFALAAITATGSAFSPLNGAASRTKPAVKSSVAAPDVDSKPIRDPFGLYPPDSPERKEGRILPLEEVPAKSNTVLDPLNLYTDKSEVSASPDMSLALPFLERPIASRIADTPGDRGFDPFNFSNNKDALQWYRDSEVKHARLAMLAAVGWPLAELMNKSIDRAPSVLNGGLGKVSPVFWAGLLTALSAVELLGIFTENNGNYGFDPLGLFGKTQEDRKFKMEAEIFNGRLAMLAIVGFAIQEFVMQTPVIEQTPLFFKPFWDAMM
jgi:hypothetical protein